MLTHDLGNPTVVVIMIRRPQQARQMKLTFFI
jgi:hypothetical protein